MRDVAPRDGKRTIAQLGRRSDCESLPGEPGALHQALFYMGLAKNRGEGIQ
jgi:hypothetical protein